MMKEKKNAPCRQSVSLLVAVVDYDRVGGNEMIGGSVKLFLSISILIIITIIQSQVG